MKTSSRGELEEAHIRGGRYCGREEAAVRLLSLQTVTPQSSFVSHGDALEDVWTLLLSLGSCSCKLGHADFEAEILFLSMSY